MKLTGFLLIIATVLLALTPAAAEVIGGDDQTVQNLAEPVLDTVLTGFNNGDYGLYSQHFDDTLKDAITPKKFQQVREDILRKLGKYQSRVYLGFLQHGKSTVALWKGRFSKADDDVLVKLVLSKRGDKILVSGLWFQ